MTAWSAETVPEEVDVLGGPEAGDTAIRGSAVRGIGYGVITLLSLVSAPLLARHLGTVGFGRYSTVLSLVALATALADAGLGALALRELALLDAAGRRRLMRNLLGIRAALTLASVAAAVAFAVAAGYGSVAVAGTAIVGAGAMTYILQGMLQLPLAVDLRLGWVTAGDVLRQVAYVAFLVVVIAAGGELLELWAVQIAAGLVGCMATAAVVRGRVPARPALDRVEWRRILRATLPIAAAGIVYTVYFRLMILLMSLLSTPEQTGEFAISFRVIEVLVPIPQLVIGVLMPVLTHAAHTNRERLAFGFERTLQAAAFAGGGVAVLTFAGAPLAISVLTGHAGAPVEILRIQAFSLVAVFLNTAYGTILVAIRRYRMLLWLNLVVLAATMLLGVVLISSHAAVGAAFAATIAECLLLALYAGRLARTDADLRPPVALVPRVALAAAAAAVTGALVHVPLVPRLGAVVVAGLVYLAVMALLRGIPPELVQALQPRGRMGRA